MGRGGCSRLWDGGGEVGGGGARSVSHLLLLLHHQPHLAFKEPPDYSAWSCCRDLLLGGWGEGGDSLTINGLLCWRGSQSRLNTHSPTEEGRKGGERNTFFISIHPENSLESTARRGSRDTGGALK